MSNPMVPEDYIKLNKANWDERAPEHAKAPDYSFQNFLSDPDFLSNVVKFDIPLLPDINGLYICHLQCHIGTDTLSLARRGAAHVTGLDFSPASINEARRLAANASGGDKLSFVEASTYDALTVLEPASFDLVFTGIGAICWLPSVNQWASIISGLLKPGGKFFMREGHPMLWTLDEKVTTHLAIRYPYFETEKPMMFQDDSTYLKLADDWKTFENARTLEWNHGIGEIVQALLEAGMEVMELHEHKSIPWEALPGQMVKLGNCENELKEGRDRIPLSYTIQAVKKK
ncbi:uncharacterized protein LTR77_008691 [Saxophila tyrrhenica]|uniref:Methyltransferase domain-containing protein n=1 Tax=Saxophila tyrrhenica TaxID=1690608 RepID=A0AAV9P3A8_9PEZI|nr:hypothetical protein LTR77_008691 [Saxophila tyrrhenica]